MPLTEKAPRTYSLVSVLAVLLLANACSSDFVVAAWACPQSPARDRMQFDSPWSTDFENGFCDYYVGNGSCYTTGTASYEIVKAPVHSGKYAAAFSVIADGTDTSTNSRCHRDGQLPTEATYGAWYYIPTFATNLDNWNLFHFQGGSGPAPRLPGLWDISLENDGNGGLRLKVVCEVPNSNFLPPSIPPAIPIGSWFHIEVFLKRAADATGEISVYQDGFSIVNQNSLITDNTTYGEWYVGNLATKLNPAESTLYVDDVTIVPTR